MVMAPVVRGRKGEYGKLLEQMRLEGYSRAQIDGELRRLDEEIVLDKKYKHDISIVVDRLVMKSGSAAAALGVGRGRGGAGRRADRGRDPRRGRGTRRGSRESALLRAVRLPQLRHLDPRAGAADLLLQLAARRLRALPRARLPAGDRPGAGRPRPDPLAREGALQPWRRGHSRYWKRLIDAVAEANGVDADVPWQELSDSDREIFLDGTGSERHQVTYSNRFGRQRSYTVRFEGIVNNLERRYEETDSEPIRERIEGYMAEQPCPQCEGARLRPESLAVKVGGHQHRRLQRAVGGGGAPVDHRTGDDRHRAGDRPADRARDHRAAGLPRQRRHRLPLALAIGPLALRRRGAADPAGDADRLEPGRRHVHPRRALDRSAPARQREADRHPQPPPRPRQHRDRGRARRGHDARRRPPDRPRAGRGRARRPRDRAGDREAGREGPGLADRPVPGGQAADRASRRAAQGRRGAADSRRPPAQPEGDRRRDSARRLLLRDRRLRLGQVDPGQRDPAPRGRQPPPPGETAARRPCRHRRARGDRQDHRHRPVADRPHAALEPGHLHRRSSTTSASSSP